MNFGLSCTSATHSKKVAMSGTSPLILSGKLEYINYLSLRDTHRFRKAKYEISHTYGGIKEILLPLNAPRLIDQADTGRRQDQIQD
jgi:hypothetical protein